MSENQSTACDHGNKFGNCAAGCLSPKPGPNDVVMTPQQFVEAVNEVTGDAEQQVAEIFENLTPEQMMQNDIDTAQTAREFRKITQGAIMAALHATKGRSGLSQAEKVEQMQTAKARLLLAVAALEKGIALAEAPAETE